jgi:hypothetical protein
LLIRAPANVPAPGGYTMYEGIIDSDRWFGPLFTNLRFTRTHAPVRLRSDFPLAQVQPLPRLAYADSTLGSTTTTAEITSMTAADWADYKAAIVDPNQDPDRNFGRYAVATRKRSRAGCPMESVAG